MGRRVTAVVLGTVLAGVCAPAGAAEPGAVRVLGEQVVAHDLDFGGTVVGGLSGIDYRPATGEFVLLSDDRSEKNPARFYTARIPVTDDGMGPVEFTGTTPLRRQDGLTYPPKSVDPEDIRVDPLTGDYLWTQEGERAGTVLADPSVRLARPDGGFGAELPIPENERMRADSGPRQNQALEAATFAAGGTLVVTALEGPLLTDGPTATPATGATTRITVQTRFGPLLAQYAYPLEPVFADSRPEPGQASNGVTAILAADPFDPTRFLVLERAFAKGVGNRVRLFEVDVTQASNVLDAPLSGARPVTKRLVADLTDLGVEAVDNIEGMTWGPRLSSGEKTLVLVADNNFAAEQRTQLIALALR
ncbi:esterase-like activity of phytase family protein [Nocardia neocaledoniensis]|uniref:esterase-like activity of phytase family protein n=1 Tax=Nocardia neocaledoniensis TaxID=236511 RepID=UPI002453B4D0|nr:esterase-like activity of phytase family protein [Nocardia neocaledoniensis]